ncbi:conserved hypothetical protein [Perkinsus marinus ATCC 50983]|uniref:Queuosine 5'-phosphate N-glycosylase/hydrolase n=1 Tax=Perkinsus marinus (strain ATCC 50983 / TXsc) TaxID=423536 RepID=C5LYJ9_PERM5|nr:conserved hypothetical protein [Perkinsus marinus ATCC 50983]EEQ98237.1 conserved hypothetical protein [Perkinsus marinus ATCC 50983]|eukprot:XP_002765520.1 conserved hypothetical protein [Perkinsus marinus ATCC 50983]
MVEAATLNEVLISTKDVVRTAHDVTINTKALDDFARSLRGDARTAARPWDQCDCHLIVDVTTDDGAELTALYVLLLDCMNFCFWPAGNFEYEQLGNGVKWALTGPQGSEWCKMDRLAEVTADEVCDWFNHGAGIVDEKDGWRPQEFPLISERVRLVREVARGLRDEYHGSALELVESADGSALRLMRILSAQFSGFRDQAIDPDTGRQVFLYKRAQICTADVWGAFRRDGKSVREKLNFRDMRALTMFPDYRVPQLLRHKGILIYSSRLENIIDSGRTIPAGSRTELEIRACTVHACHEIVEIAQREDIFDVTLDWLLWQEGEAVRDEIKPHHRTLTIFY